MSRRYPSLRVPTELGRLGTHDVLTLKFFMPHPHRVVASRVWRVLPTFLQALPPDTLKWYVTLEGEWEALNEAGWADIHHTTFREPLAVGGRALVADVYNSEHEYFFEYAGRWVDEPKLAPEQRTLASAVSFTLPTEYLEKHGPPHVRSLALALAEELPFSFGYASLALIAGPLMQQETRPLLLRFPGLDLCHLQTASESMGTGARGAYWLTFLGQPLLGQLGGLDSLRQRLPFPDISFHTLDEDRALLTVGEWPELGEEGVAPSLCALARLLEPFFPQEKIAHISWRQEDSDLWLRRYCL